MTKLLNPFLGLPGFKAVSINPIRTGGPELTIKTGGGQKRLRYIIGPYLGHFKSDFIGVKSKFQNYID